MDLQYIFGFSNALRSTGSLERHPTPRRRTSEPGPPHTAALGVPGARRGAAGKLCERVVSKRALLGAGCLTPGMGGVPGKGGVSNLFQAFISRGYCFVCPVSGFHLYGMRLVWGREGYPSSPGMHYPFLGSEVERSNM